eukprot:6983874-Prymnesium_polylepis.1
MGWRGFGARARVHLGALTDGDNQPLPLERREELPVLLRKSVLRRHRKVCVERIPLTGALEQHAHLQRLRLLLEARLRAGREQRRLVLAVRTRMDVHAQARRPQLHKDLLAELLRGHAARVTALGCLVHQHVVGHLTALGPLDPLWLWLRRLDYRRLPNRLGLARHRGGRRLLGRRSERRL